MKEGYFTNTPRVHDHSYWLTGLIIFLIVLLIVLGVIAHELYRLSGNNKFIGYFFPTSESTWEHLKLIFTPFLIIGLILWLFISGCTNNYIFALAIAILTGCAFIVVAFYTYVGVIGRDIFQIDIMIFILAVLLSAWIFYIFITREVLPSWTEIVGVSILFILAGLFIVYSFNPPSIALFDDPTN